MRGLSSGSVGFLAKASDSTGENEIALLQTSGAFITGEQLIVNEKDTDKLSIKTVLQFTVDDIKSVFQDADTLDTDLPSNFSADSVLYDRVLPGFSPADQINICLLYTSPSPRD